MLDDVDNDDDVETEVDVDTLLSKAHHRISIELNLNFLGQKKYQVTETYLLVDGFVVEYLEDDVENVSVVGVERLDDVESKDDVDVEEEEVE